METLLVAVIAMAINQMVKLIIRSMGVSKTFAQGVVLAFGFLLCCTYTLLQQKGIISPEMVAQATEYFILTIGIYEVGLNKLGIDSWMKDVLAIERG